MRNLIQEAIYKNCKLTDDTKMAYYWETEDNKYMVALSNKGKAEYFILKFNDRKKRASYQRNLMEVNDFTIYSGDYFIMLEPISENASVTIDCGTDKDTAINFVKDLREQHSAQKREHARREKFLRQQNKKQDKTL